MLHPLATVAQINVEEELHADDGKEVIDEDDDHDEAQ
jgi:hypothetical protein